MFEALTLPQREVVARPRPPNSPQDDAAAVRGSRRRGAWGAVSQAGAAGKACGAARRGAGGGARVWTPPTSSSQAAGAGGAARARRLKIDLNIFINVRCDLSLISRRGGGRGREVTNGPSLDQNLLKGLS